MPDFTTFNLEVRDGIAIATFSRPDKMNTFTGTKMAEMISLFDLTDRDDTVRAVIVTGSGRAFCAGADLGAGGDTFDSSKRERPKEYVVNGVQRDGGGLVTLRLFRSLKPVIAAVNGAAVGVGVTMHLPMDCRLASTEARFGFVFSRRGIAPEACSTWFLPREGGGDVPVTSADLVRSLGILHVDDRIRQPVTQHRDCVDEPLPRRSQPAARREPAAAVCPDGIEHPEPRRGAGRFANDQ
jgi:hypothetical protein